MRREQWGQDKAYDRFRGRNIWKEFHETTGPKNDLGTLEAEEAGGGRLRVHEFHFSMSQTTKRNNKKLGQKTSAV